MRKDSPVNDPEKHLTEAEKQIKRLEELRRQREETSKASVQDAYFPQKTFADRTAEKLMAMRDQAHKPAVARKRRPKIEGKQKSAKLTFIQIRILEQLFAADKRLRASAITRIALNRALGLENTDEQNELEARINEILRQYKNR